MTLARFGGSCYTAPPAERRTSREAEGRDGSDMAEGRFWSNRAGRLGAVGALLAGRSNPEKERPGVVPWAQRVSRAFCCSPSRAPRSRVWSAIPMATPLWRPRPPGTWAGGGAGSGGPVRGLGAATGIPRAAGEAPLTPGGARTAGEVTLLRKSKLLSGLVPHPEGVHPSPAEELGTPPREGLGEARAVTGCNRANAPNGLKL